MSAMAAVMFFLPIQYQPLVLLPARDHAKMVIDFGAA